MRLSGSFVLLAMLVAGCGSKGESVRGVPPEQQGDPPPSAAPAAEGDTDKENLGKVPLPGDRPAAAPAAAGEEKPERDLGAELQRAIGSPVTCLQDFRASQATTISIYVTATVRPTGLLIEPSASGAGVSAEAAKCIQQLAGAVRLQPLDTETSQRVSTTVRVDFEPAEVVAAPEPVREVPADVVLPQPKKPTIPPSGEPIDGPSGVAIDGPRGQPIDGPQGRPIDGPQGIPIDQGGY